MTTEVRRRMSVEERREQLIAVALDLFSHRPPDTVSIDDIAMAAGISRPLVYRYFTCKKSLYEIALRRAADELTALFEEPVEGPPVARLLRVLRRFLDFVEGYAPGYAALLRGGPATAGAGAAVSLIDGVRGAAYARLLEHLGVREPTPRLELTLRSWISLVETTALLWLDGRGIPRPELEAQLAHALMALVAVGAAHDEDTAAVLARVLADEPADGPVAALAVRLSCAGRPLPSCPGR